DHRERNDLDLAAELLAHVQPADEMGRDAHLVELVEDVLTDAVVERALAVNNLVLLLVEGGGVVLEELNERARFRAFEQNLALALVNAPAAVHGYIPRFEKIHFGSGFQATEGVAFR